MSPHPTHHATDHRDHVADVRDGLADRRDFMADKRYVAFEDAANCSLCKITPRQLWAYIAIGAASWGGVAATLYCLQTTFTEFKADTNATLQRIESKVDANNTRYGADPRAPNDTPTAQASN